MGDSVYYATVTGGYGTHGGVIVCTLDGVTSSPTVCVTVSLVRALQWKVTMIQMHSFICVN